MFEYKFCIRVHVNLEFVFMTHNNKNQWFEIARDNKRTSVSVDSIIILVDLIFFSLLQLLNPEIHNTILRQEYVFVVSESCSIIITTQKTTLFVWISHKILNVKNILFPSSLEILGFALSQFGLPIAFKRRYAVFTRIYRIIYYERKTNAFVTIGKRRSSYSVRPIRHQTGRRLPMITFCRVG